MGHRNKKPKRARPPDRGRPPKAPPLSDADNPKLGASARFAAFVKAKAWSMKDAGKAFSCAPSYVSMLQRGTVTPGLALASRIEAVTGIPSSAWMGGP